MIHTAHGDQRLDRQQDEKAAGPRGHALAAAELCEAGKTVAENGGGEAR